MTKRERFFAERRASVERRQWFCRLRCDGPRFIITNDIRHLTPSIALKVIRDVLSSPVNR